MKTCDYCTHVEMCGWRKEVKEQGCEFFGDGIAWIPVSERLPKINQSVLLSGNSGTIIVGHREKPDLVWQVTEEDGRKHWVYDPEHYTDDIESLPKAEDCSFDSDSEYSDGGMLSVSSINYNDRFEGVTAWMPLPEPYREEGDR